MCFLSFRHISMNNLHLVRLTYDDPFYILSINYDAIIEWSDKYDIRALRVLIA